MKLLYTEQALESLQEALSLISDDAPESKLMEIRDNILNRADTLLSNPKIGQREEYLRHLGLKHRRIVESHYKIIYRIAGEYIYITDIFDTRQDPAKMKG